MSTPCCRPFCVGIVSVLLLLCHPAPIAAASLEADWAQPPLAARTRCFWLWLNGNVDQVAITKDLEWMNILK